MTRSKTRVLIGVDVGGTNTDAVVMEGKQVLGWCKQQTTDDVTTGVLDAIDGALKKAAGECHVRHTALVSDLTWRPCSHLSGTCGHMTCIKCRFSGSDAWTELLRVGRVHIGTTHFLNAVLQRRHLARVAVIRLCGPASTDLPPYCDFPQGLKSVSDDGAMRRGT